jgi:polyferredoxin
MSYTAWRRLRRGVQFLALALFVYLLLGTTQGGNTFLPHDLFFCLDPLVGLSAMLAGREWIAPLALGAATLLLVFILGNVWCGWLCPLGTLLDWTPLYRLRRRRSKVAPSWRNVKYLLLITILLTAALGSLTPLVLDPITILFRTFASVVLPILGSLTTAVNSALYRVEFLQPAVEWYDNLMRGVLPLDQSFVLQNLSILLVAAGVFTLNFIQPRFWCRYLCPLGALLGLASRYPWLRYRVSETSCIACGDCASVCPAGAIEPEHDYTANLADCDVCLACAEACPAEAITFGWHRFHLPRLRRPHMHWPREFLDKGKYDPTRRQAIGLFGAAAVCALLLRYIPDVSKRPRLPIRPPGTVEDEFLDRCIRCGECVKVCPTGGLQPTFLSAGLDGLWAPELIPRIGYCDYSCNACGAVCPSRAIPELPLEEKRLTPLGIARIDKDRCLPWAEGTDCIVCWELCPVPGAAIQLKKHGAGGPGGRGSVLCPEMIEESCIGCGICENKCPIQGESAIRVYAAGDSGVELS